MTPAPGASNLAAGAGRATGGGALGWRRQGSGGLTRPRSSRWIEDDAAPEYFASMLRAWRTGDVAEIDRILREESGGLTPRRYRGAARCAQRGRWPRHERGLSPAAGPFIAGGWARGTSARRTAGNPCRAGLRAAAGARCERLTPTTRSRHDRHLHQLRHEDRERAPAVCLWPSRRGAGRCGGIGGSCRVRLSMRPMRAGEAAKCVVVLWSPDSAASEWVKNEAAVGAERGVLVPASCRSSCRWSFAASRRRI